MKIENKKIGAIVFALLMLVGLNTNVFAEEVVEVVEVVEEETVKVDLTIRDGENIIFDDEVELKDSGNFELNDSNGSPHNLNNRSVLSIVHDADLLDNSWSVSDLQYSSTYGSFYLRCIESSFGADCDNWQYAVDGSIPSFGMDQKILNGGENVYLYFGQSNRVVLSSNSITEGTSLTVTTEKYDYENNTWLPRGGVTVGLTQPNPSDMFNPIEVATNTVNSSGETIFTNIIAGSYNVGVKEDYYFPTEVLDVNKVSVSSSGSGGGGSSKNKTTTSTGEVLGADTKQKFDLNKSFEFLKSKQEENGSFGEDIYTDWATIALSTGNNQGNILKLVKYFGESSTKDYILTDFERRAMTLMTLGLNPYNTNGVNYIGEIVNKFDGKQFGDVSEDNDDIFALLVLQNAGYEEKDKMIANDIAFILERQKENGSWDESIDMTGAGIAALTKFNADEKVKAALDEARAFLRKSQKNDGGFGNISATAWAMEGIISLGDEMKSWTKETNTPLDYFGSFQDTDGGIKNENIKNKIWETSYAIKAFSPKTWNELMYDFKKEGGAGKVLGATTEVKKEKTTTPVVKKEIKKTTTIKPVEKVEEKKELPVNIELSANTETETEKTKEKSWFSKLINFIF